MADKRERWLAHYDGTWWVILDSRHQKVAARMSMEDVRQIVREHNMHGRLVEACKAALAQSLLTMRDGSGRKSCHHCAHGGRT